MPVQAKMWNTQDNEKFIQSSVPSGKTGKTMSVSFKFRADQDYEHLWIGIAYDETIYGVNTDDTDDSTDNKNYISDYVFPFEADQSTFKPHDYGKIKEGAEKSISFSAKVRRDIPAGYYAVGLYASPYDGRSSQADEYINVWITQSSASDSTDTEEVKDVAFVLGEGNKTPYGVYPEVMNFSLNLRNRGLVTAQDATASIVAAKSDDDYPFDINEANYDHHFDKIGTGETVQLDYSMAIRKDVYTGFYPIKVNVTYRESSEGELKTAELQFFAHVVNKEKETTADSTTEFNQNTNSKSRIIVSSYHTEPEQIFAGQPFDLILDMKNASGSIPASNLMFSFSSEKVSDSAVFTTDSGSSSIVVDSLGAGETTELKMRFTARAGVDQRSYSMTIKEKYDSPNYKNAEESVEIDLPVLQEQHMGIGNIDVTPDTIAVGEESNVMFPVNNTGKVTIYNVTASFAADSIVPNEAYVGNVKSGETGNIDIMLKGAAATADDGKIKVTITYEDENGKKTSEEKRFTLTVTDETAGTQTDETAADENMPGVSAPWYRKWQVYLAAVLAVLAAVLIIRHRRKKKQSEENAENTDS